MARYKIAFQVDGSRIDAVKAQVKKAFENEVVAQIEKVSLSQSRADRLSDAESSFEDAKGEVESLKDELQDWHDNLPENLQSGSKASEIEDAVSELESLLDSMESCDFSSVSFPGMY